jgi:hypothetical protein
MRTKVCPAPGKATLFTKTCLCDLLKILDRWNSVYQITAKIYSEQFWNFVKGYVD